MVVVKLIVWRTKQGNGTDADSPFQLLFPIILLCQLLLFSLCLFDWSLTGPCEASQFFHKLLGSQRLVQRWVSSSNRGSGNHKRRCLPRPLLASVRTRRPDSAQPSRARDNEERGNKFQMSSQAHSRTILAVTSWVKDSIKTVQSELSKRTQRQLTYYLQLTHLSSDWVFLSVGGGKQNVFLNLQKGQNNAGGWEASCAGDEPRPRVQQLAKGFLEVCREAALDCKGIAEDKRRRGEEEGAYLKGRNFYNLYTNGLVK